MSEAASSHCSIDDNSDFGGDNPLLTVASQLDFKPTHLNLKECESTL